MNYRWCCPVCEISNASVQDRCQRCNSAPELSSYEIEARKKAYRLGIDIDDDDREYWVSVTLEGRLDRISVGQDPAFRKFGDYCLIFAAVAVIFSVMGGAIAGNLSSAWYALAFLSLFSAWDARNFFRGKTTHMDHLSCKAIPENLGNRVVGLLFDMFLMFFAVINIID
jgi:hypothetical protein